MPGRQRDRGADDGRRAARGRRARRPGEAAIASERAAAAARAARDRSRDVGDHPEAYTRFVSLATHTRLDATARTGARRSRSSPTTEPGALHRAIEPFGRHEIDLVQLVSRPIPQSPWRYRFDAVLAGHPLDPESAGRALAEAARASRQLRVFGSYPAGV